RGFEGLGFCLSECSDLLSQWRGYADNANGVCIGFSHDRLRELSEALMPTDKTGFKVIKVNYEVDRQRSELEPTFKILQNYIDDGVFRTPTLISSAGKSKEERKQEEEIRIANHKRMSLHVLELFPKLFEHKNPAFSEEAEWRVVSPYVKLFEHENVEFRATDNRIIPYRKFDFDPNSGMIEEVILGPKNTTPVEIVEAALRRYGLSDVEVRQSNATYR
ncbi:MAG: DUF2971 domain-containing protein, partial [Gammaproteobacteria bacterium]|nr:DUF2971 domain-containing protein [Gammaproteobacteria bacterium]